MSPKLSRVRTALFFLCSASRRIKVVPAEVSIDGWITQDMVHKDDHGMGYGHDGFLLGYVDTEVLVVGREIGIFLPNGSMGCQHHRRP